MNESSSIHTYQGVLNELRKRLKEPAPAYIQIVSGPRQVGKTTLLLQLTKEWKEQAIYAAADSAEASFPGWWDSLWNQAEKRAQRDVCVLLIDEIPYLPSWGRLLKVKFDEMKRRGIPVRVVVTGSSSLRLGSGAKESMAGRFERLRLQHWPPLEFSKRFGVSPQDAVVQYVRYGCMPGAVPFGDDMERRKKYVQAAIIEPALERDVLTMEAVRKPALMRRVFSVCTGHPAEIVSIQKICGEMTERASLPTTAHYLRILEELSLVAALQKYSARTVRLRSAPPKLVALSNAFLAAVAPRLPPDPATEPEKWGRWIENACIARAWNDGQSVYYWRQEPYEVDMVIEGNWGQWAVEIKTADWSKASLAGLFEFCRQHKGFRPLVVCDRSYVGTARSAHVEAISWQDYLIRGLLPTG